MIFGFIKLFRKYVSAINICHQESYIIIFIYKQTICILEDIFTSISDVKYMSFFTFKLRQPNLDQLVPQQREIVELSGKVASKKIVTFEGEWIKQLLTLFGTKEEIQLFWVMFSQSFLPNNGSPNNPLASNTLPEAFKTHQNSKQKSNRGSLESTEELDQMKINENGLGQDQVHNAFQTNYLKSYQEQSMLYPKVQGMGSRWKKPSSLPTQTYQKLRRDYFDCKTNNRKFIVKDYAQLLNVTRTTIYRFINKWDGELLYNNYLQNHLKYHRSTKFTEDHQMMLWTKGIQDVLRENPTANHKDIKNALVKLGFATLPDLKTIKRVLFTINHIEKRPPPKLSESNTQIYKRLPE